MKKHNSVAIGSMKFGNAVIVAGAILYCGGRFLKAAPYFNGVSPQKAQLLAYYGAALLLTLAALVFAVRKNRDVTTALFVPFVVYFIILAADIIAGDFEFFFVMYLGVFAVCCIYQNFKSSVIFLTLTAISNLSLFFFRFAATYAGVSRFTAEGALQNTAGALHNTSGALLVDWLIALASSLALLTLTRAASRKSGEANRGLMAFDTLLSSTPNYMVLIDEMKRVMYISEPLARLAKAGGQIMAIGRPLLDLFASKDLKLMFSDIIDSKDLFEDTRELVVDGQTKYFKIIANKLSGIINGMFIDLTDITPAIQSKIEADDARFAAEQASRAKSIFLARMSHEIRTPMNAIIGMGDLIRTDNLDRIQAGYFSDIKRSSKALMQIINDILDFSKIEAEKLDILPVDFNLKNLYENMCSLITFSAGVKDLEFRSEYADELPDVVFGDEIRVRQIITNLLSNAVKYTRTGVVSFRVCASPEFGDEFIGFVVEDSGIGIHKEDIPKLFESFGQIDQARNRGIVGTGLGLSIVKRLTDLMGGRIEIFSEYGVGSRFSVYLPLPQGDPSVIDNVFMMPHVIAKPGASILVVDDNQINLTVARAFLSTHGIDADMAVSGYEAVNKIRKRDYDIVFMDHMMPDINGIEATKLIRAMDGLRHKNLPIIALTANAVLGERKSFIAAGMSDYLPKPILSGDMNRILQKWLPAERILRYDNYAQSDSEAAGAEPAGEGLIDAERGLLHSAGNQRLYGQLLADFSGNYKDAYRRIVDGIEDGDLALSYRLAHTLKSSARMIGADALADAAQVVEDGLSEGDMRCTDGQLFTLRQALIGVLREVGGSGAAGDSGESGAAGDGPEADETDGEEYTGAGSSNGAFAKAGASDGPYAKAGSAGEQRPGTGFVTSIDYARARRRDESEGAQNIAAAIPEASLPLARDALEKLRPLVKSHRASAMQYIDSIGNALSPFGAVAATLAKQLENYDYKGAMAAIDAIAALIDEAEAKYAKKNAESAAEARARAAGGGILIDLTQRRTDRMA